MNNKPKTSLIKVTIILVFLQISHLTYANSVGFFKKLTLASKSKTRSTQSLLRDALKADLAVYSDKLNAYFLEAEKIHAMHIKQGTKARFPIHNKLIQLGSNQLDLADANFRINYDDFKSDSFPIRVYNGNGTMPSMELYLQAYVTEADEVLLLFTSVYTNPNIIPVKTSDEMGASLHRVIHTKISTVLNTSFGLSNSEVSELIGNPIAYRLNVPISASKTLHVNTTSLDLSSLPDNKTLLISLVQIIEDLSLL